MTVASEGTQTAVSDGQCQRMLQPTVVHIVQILMRVLRVTHNQSASQSVAILITIVAVIETGATSVHP